MTVDLSQSLATISRISKLISDIFKQAEGDHERGTRLAEEVRGLWPICGLSACLLCRDRAPYGSALDASGAARIDWRDTLLGVLSSEEEELPTALPAAIVLPDHALALEWIAGPDRRIGLFALAVPDHVPKEVCTVLKIFVAECAVQLGLNLLAEAREHARRRLAEEVSDLAWLANVGELAGPIIHEFNNFLNVSLLNVTILEKLADESIRSDLASIRRQGTETAGLVRRLQQYRQKDRPSHRPVDLNQVVVELLPNPDPSAPVRITVNSGEAKVRFEPSPALLPLVFGSAPDLKRMLRFLLSHSVAANAGYVDVCIQTGATEESVWLKVEDSGPAVAPEMLPHLFDSQKSSRKGVDQLELAACKSLVRRMRGEIRAENRNGSGLAVTVELPIGLAAGTR